MFEQFAVVVFLHLCKFISFLSFVIYILSNKLIFTLDTVFQQTNNNNNICIMMKTLSAVSLSELSQLCYSYLMPVCHGSSQTPLPIMTLCLLQMSLTDQQNTKKLKLQNQMTLFRLFSYII